MPKERENKNYKFICTFCEEVILWDLTNKDLGLSEDEEPQIGAIYPYSGCYCGWGKYVLCEGYW
jgi:hypothetical protein